jgi:hypothetical protein
MHAAPWFAVDTCGFASRSEMMDTAQELMHTVIKSFGIVPDADDDVDGDSDGDGGGGGHRLMGVPRQPLHQPL